MSELVLQCPLDSRTAAKYLLDSGDTVQRSLGLILKEHTRYLHTAIYLKDGVILYFLIVSKSSENTKTTMH